MLHTARQPDVRQLAYVVFAHEHVERLDVEMHEGRAECMEIEQPLGGVEQHLLTETQPRELLTVLAEAVVE